jgi:4-amino-4-deoxy-L-arabinose transferase-like glycosyltransferase
MDTSTTEVPTPTARNRSKRSESLALCGLLALTAILYIWDLSANHYANEFYSAAVQAGTQNAKAWLFGSLDPGNSITVDKPPAAYWVATAFARLFGFSSWSVLLPQALEGIGSVWLLYATVRRLSGHRAALIAGALLALTPVAVLMFRFNNPDALLVLLTTLASYCVVRALPRASWRWLVFAGVAIGFAFLTKMMAGLLVVPALAITYLVAAPTSLRARIGHVLAAGAAVVVSAGWYVALVALWPAGSRPYVGGSTTNSLLELALGYNGFQRIFGRSGGGGGAAGRAPTGGTGTQVPGAAGGIGAAGGHGGPGFGGGHGFSGSAGIGRLFGSEMGTQISWLLPAALIILVAGFFVVRRAPRTDPTRAALLLWGGSLVVTGLVFSFMSGIVHPYYTVALAPAIGALVGMGIVRLWRDRLLRPARPLLAALVVITAVWSAVLLSRTPSWLPWLRWTILALAAVSTVAILVGVQRFRRIGAAVLVLVAVSALAGPSAYAVTTVSTAQDGAMPNAGPHVAGNTSGPGGLRPPGANVGRPGGNQSAHRGFGERQANPQIDALVGKTDTKWAAATVGSQEAGSLELATGKSVMAIGGFSGSDPSPTLAQFQRYVATGQIRYFIPGGGFGGPPTGSGSPTGGSSRMGGQAATRGPANDRHNSAIATWVQSHFRATAVGGQQVYDLTSPR